MNNKTNHTMNPSPKTAPRSLTVNPQPLGGRPASMIRHYSEACDGVCSAVSDRSSDIRKHWPSRGLVSSGRPAMAGGVSLGQEPSRDDRAKNGDAPHGRERRRSAPERVLHRYHAPMGRGL